MTGTRVKLIYPGFLEIRRQAAVKVCEPVGREIAVTATSMARHASGAQPAYEASQAKPTKHGAMVFVSASHASPVVWTVSTYAENKHHWLEKALGAGV